jgi:hypothetical protein
MSIYDEESKALETFLDYLVDYGGLGLGIYGGYLIGKEGVNLINAGLVIATFVTPFISADIRETYKYENYKFVAGALGQLFRNLLCYIGSLGLYDLCLNEPDCIDKIIFSFKEHKSMFKLMGTVVVAGEALNTLERVVNYLFSNETIE